jgi:ABC-2 type transport system ATP-binding protein
VLAKRPALLLLDEPLANLDPLARREFLTSMFATCAEDGVAVLFSSHVIAELERICDYLIVMLAGRVQIAGDIDVLRAGHRVITGPLDWPERTAANVVSASHIAGRTTALIRLDSGASLGPGFEESEPTFDELALGYLAKPHPRPAEVTA